MLIYPSKAMLWLVGAALLSIATTPRLYHSFTVFTYCLALSPTFLWLACPFCHAALFSVFTSKGLDLAITIGTFSLAFSLTHLWWFGIAAHLPISATKGFCFSFTV